MNEIRGRERDELVALVRRIIDADFDSESLLDAALEETAQPRVVRVAPIGRILSRASGIIPL